MGKVRQEAGSRVRFGCDVTYHTYPVLTRFVSLLKSQYTQNQLAELL